MGLLVPPFWRSDASVGLLRPQEKRQQGIAGIHCRIQRSLSIEAHRRHVALYQGVLPAVAGAMIVERFV
jgi:hypothetical protein